METRPTVCRPVSVIELEQIANLAYQRWEAEGRPRDRNLDLWSWAETQFLTGQDPLRIPAPERSPAFSRATL